MKRLPGLKPFIEVSVKVHDNFYDYSKFIYIKNNINGIIICPLHGEFQQSPATHVKGANCPKCVSIKRGNGCRMSKEEFIIKSISIHGQIYDYSKAVYLTAQKKVEIVCSIHGSFWMRPNDHLSGQQGCSNCFGKKEHTLESFLTIAKIKHCNLYGYSKVVYKGYKKHVIIICGKHGEFKQSPKNHMRGDGCPNCFESNGERVIRKYLEKKVISFEMQKRFDGCRSILHTKNRLPFDFFLPDLNIVIEYDGKQHYEPHQIRGISLERAQLNFERLQINDLIKTKYCLDNGIKLLRIPYTEFKRIDEILNNALRRNIKVGV